MNFGKKVRPTIPSLNVLSMTIENDKSISDII